MKPDTPEAKAIKDAADLLERHNKWRRSCEDLPMVNTTELGLAIDVVVKHLRATIC